MVTDVKLFKMRQQLLRKNALSLSPMTRTRISQKADLLLQDMIQLNKFYSVSSTISRYISVLRGKVNPHIFIKNINLRESESFTIY